MDKKDNSQPLSAKVSREIKNMIISGELLPGSAIREAEVSKRFGVSRTPVRDAIRQLELEGLVHSTHNKGTVVTGVSINDIEEIFTVRAYLEGRVAFWACENISEDELESMRENVDLQQFYLLRGEIQRIWELDSRFHNIIYNCCLNRLIQQTLANFHQYTIKARDISINSEGRAKSSVEEHTAIYEAILNRDKEKAERLAVEHINHTKDNLFKLLSQK